MMELQLVTIWVVLALGQLRQGRWALGAKGGVRCQCCEQDGTEHALQLARMVGVLRPVRAGACARLGVLQNEC